MLLNSLCWKLFGSLWWDLSWGYCAGGCCECSLCSRCTDVQPGVTTEHWNLLQEVWSLFLLALELLNSNLLNNCFAIMMIALSYYILRELFKEVFDLRCLFFVPGFSGFFPTRYFCQLTWCGWCNHFGAWRGLWERRNGAWDHPEMNLLFLEENFTPAVSYVCQPLFLLTFSFPLGAICVSFQPNTDYWWEIVVLKLEFWNLT